MNKIKFFQMIIFYIISTFAFIGAFYLFDNSSFQNNNIKLISTSMLCAAVIFIPFEKFLLKIFKTNKNNFSKNLFNLVKEVFLYIQIFYPFLLLFLCLFKKLNFTRICTYWFVLLHGI